MPEIAASPVADQPFTVMLQFVKDLAFVVPQGANVFARLQEQPETRAKVWAETQPSDRGQGVHEAVVCAEVHALSPAAADEPVFSLRLAYVGVILLRDVQARHVEYMTLVEAPRLLFPFVRQIVSAVTRDGGFQPVRLPPMDFNRQFRDSRGLPPVDAEAAK